MGADAVAADPKHYEVEFENDRVRILRVKYGPGEKSVMHSHPPSVVIILTDCDFRTYMGHGRKQHIVGKAGQIITFEEPFEHLPENASQKTFEALLIELKP